jgi:uncharacterized protein YjiS (DUF1127 family)
MTTFKTDPQPWFKLPHFSLEPFGFANAWAKHKTRKVLRKLDSDQLKDIGLYRGGVKPLNSRYWELR